MSALEAYVGLESTVQSDAAGGVSRTSEPADRASGESQPDEDQEDRPPATADRPDLPDPEESSE